jgi:ribonuclease E
MPRQIIIDEHHRIAAVFSEEQIQELIVASGDHQVGDIYLGMVENVLPSIDAAFVNIGSSERNGFIHVSDLGPLRLKRSSASITELVAPQQRVLVQVMKEPTGNKGPRLTGEVSLPGRYLVLMPHGRGVNLSSRIQDEEERNRLKSLAILIKPTQMGLLVRTEARGVSDEAIIEDLEQLKTQWEDIQQQQQKAREPGLLNRDDDFIQRVLRDTYSADVNRIVTDSSTGLKRVKQYLQGWNQGQMPAGVFVDAHREGTQILEFFRVNAAIRQALRPRVDLPSGGYIIIEPTEALTVIDVNSGSFTQSATARETVLWTNCEAATEIARQLRLRNIAGVIVVDFIDMDSRRDQLQVLEHFNKALRHDKARPQVAQLSELGLVELTRKRQGQSLYEVFGRTCPTCDGLGLLAHLPGTEDSHLTPIREQQRLSPHKLEGDMEGDEEGEDSSMPILAGRDRNGGRVGAKAKLRPGFSRRNRPPSKRDEGGPLLPGVETSEGSDPLLTPAMGALSPRERGTMRADRGTRGRPFDRERPESQEGNGEPPTRTRELPRRIVSVDMTPLQQQVFSEMGLSPRLLLDMPVSSSRDTTIVVKSPDAKSDSAPADLPLKTAVESEIVPEIETSLPDETAAPPSQEERSFSPLALPSEADVSSQSQFPEDLESPKKQQSPAASRRRRSSRNSEEE